MNAKHYARFWIRQNNDWVKLTLVNGQTLTLVEGDTTRVYAYGQDGVEVSLNVATRRRDGSVATRELTCPRADLTANEDEDDKTLPSHPAWNLVHDSILSQPAYVNARFWIRWNGGWVKLTLSPGQVVTLRTGGDTDEGWSYARRTYYHDGSIVSLDNDSESQDCDGRHSSYRNVSCPLARLKANNEQDDADEPRPPLPAWRTEDRPRRTASGQRCVDHAAEAAGY